MLNFTIGPVTFYKETLDIASKQTPYFRTEEFSKIMMENEKYILKLCNAPKDSRAIFLTCSSTGSMEAVVMNLFSNKDKVLVINGGTFGQRFVDLCKIHNLNYKAIKLKPGEKLRKETLYRYDNKGFTALLVNVCESSTGALYDVNEIGEFAKKNDMFFVCDCVSSFLADPFDMNKCSADALIIGSQKALACEPGLSMIVLSNKAIKRIKKSTCKTMYFDLKDILNNQDRGQTPFTPAVKTILQVNNRLKSIDKNGGVETEINNVINISQDFRTRIKDLPLQIFSEIPSNGITALHPRKNNAYKIYSKLKDEYNIWVCPNGGELKDIVFRVGHMGNLSYQDNITLVNALTDLYKKGIL